MQRTRLLTAAAAAALIVVIAAGAVLLGRSVDTDPVTLEHQFPADSAEPTWIRVEADDGDPREVTLTWALLTTTFTHPAEKAVTYFFPLGVGRPGPLTVTVAPEATVVFGSGDIDGESVDVAATPWDEADVPADPDVVAPEPDADGTGVTMSVDEAYSYGLVVEGVGLRAAPDYVSDKTSVLSHGDRLRVTCWVEAEEVTNGNNGDPSDDATQYWSTIWWHVDQPDLEGYVSDVWLGRTDGEVFGLPECSSTQG